MKATEEALEALQSRYSALDKTKTRLAAELEDLNLDIEKVQISKYIQEGIEMGVNGFLGAKPGSQPGEKAEAD